jgi:hypothetical protein
MPRSGHKRLARLAARLPDMSPDACRDRAALRLQAEVRDLIYETAVRAASINPVMIYAIRECAEAADQLRALGDSPELVAADARVLWADSAANNEDDASGPGLLESELEKIVARYADGGEPGPSGSLFEWWGWALAHPAPDPPGATP